LHQLNLTTTILLSAKKITNIDSRKINGLFRLNDSERGKITLKNITFLNSNEQKDFLIKFSIKNEKFIN